MKTCVICGSTEFNLNSERFCSQECIHLYGVQKMSEKIECKICHKLFSKGNYKKHLQTHQEKPKEIYHYFCENCGKEVFERYGSCRFCSKECAKGFSTKAKRKEISEKVSIKIKEKIKNGEKIGFCTSGRIVEFENRICPICGNLYETNKNFPKVACSRKCSAKAGGLKNLGKKHIIKDTSRMGGLRPGGGKAKQLPYTNWLGYKMSLNKEEIEVAKVLDEKKLNWRRNTKGFPYITEDGKKRNYYPDFVIDEDKYIEYKGWVTKEMEHKMCNACETNDLNLIIIVGNDKRYEKFGITLEKFKI